MCFTQSYEMMCVHGACACRAWNEEAMRHEGMVRGAWCVCVRLCVIVTSPFYLADTVTTKIMHFYVKPCHCINTQHIIRYRISLEMCDM